MKYLIIPILLVATILAGCGAKVVPVSNLKGLTEQQVKERAVDAGYKLKVEFKYKRRSGKEVVVDQYPFAGNTVRENGTVSVQMADEDFYTALALAWSQIYQADELLRACRHAEIDVSDLAPAMTQAKSIYKKAKTIEELAGEENSAVFYANTVINACTQRGVTHGIPGPPGDNSPE